MFKTYLCFVIISSFSYSECARILGAVFTPSYSHQVAFQPIWKELSLRGHQLTVLTTNPLNDSSLKNLTEIDLSMSYDTMKAYKADEILSSNNDSVAVRIKKYMEALHVIADKQLAHPKVQDLLHNKRNDFDLLMVEAIYPTQMAFSWWFNIPFIGLISLDAPSRIHAAVGNPVHPVLYPDYDLPFDKNLTFGERVISTLFHCAMLLYTKFRLHAREERTLRKYFGEDVPPINEIQKNMSMLFINANPIFHNIRPLVPATIQIGGGIHLREPKPLPKDIQEYLDNSSDGFIYFSLGTNVKSAALPPQIKDAILQTFAELPYNILWKFEDEHIPNKPKNVKIVKWLPQTAVLAHKNIKAFIMQCGLQSMEEAIVYNVPMIGLPFYGDQGNNAKVLESKGLGIRLNTEKLEKNTFSNAILTVISDTKYKDNLKELAALYSDHPMSGLEKAIWWTEYVIRHKGAKHLRSHIIDVPMYQYLLLDVIAFIAAVLTAIIFVITITLKFIFRRVFRRNSKIKKE
nr:PREDICTED: UDP-glucuronosyltransferase 2B7 isoform X2 [Tribolium castaneum]|eukprot:XP_015833981.1 PREDICTED: UDP-glucuronosyltransferase 2B7 isoform X2 [Tribolium castaneum]